MSETDIPKLNCRSNGCGSDNTNVEWHNGRLTWLIRCNICKNISWQPNDGSKNRPAPHKDLVKKRGIQYCESCLRHKDQIPPPGTLHGHHVIEYKDGGTDDNSNIWVLCSACHIWVHWARDYFGHYKNLKNG